MSYEDVGCYIFVVIQSLGVLAIMVFASTIARKFAGKHAIALFLLAGFATWFGHYSTGDEKGMVRGVVFFNTSPDINYLQNRGSYIYSNRVDIVMAIKGLPDSAHIQLWTSPLNVTNWVCHSDETVADWKRYYVPELGQWERSFEYENAASNSWCIFTTYIRPSQVVTNGVLHAPGVLLWREDKHDVSGVPLHAGVYVDGNEIDLGTKFKSREGGENE